jgi:C-terminal processing protease CtpA/Prc
MIKQIITITTFLFLSSNLLAQKIINNDFSLLCDSSSTKFCNWDISWGEKLISIGLEGSNRFLKVEGISENSVGFVEQEIFIENSSQLRILTLTASVSSKEIEGKGAGLNVSFFDENGNLISSKDMGGFYSTKWMKGTHDWTIQKIRTICPIGTKKIKVGAILYGSGIASFDNFSMSLNHLEADNENQLAKEFVEEIITVVKNHSLYRDSLNFVDLYNKSISIAGNPKTTSDIYIVLDFIFSELEKYGDDHSFFMTPDEVKNWETPSSKDEYIKLPEYKVVENFGYIEVPAFHGGNDSLIMKYALTLQSGIKKLNEREIEGWIIDLRENTGGNMEPMIAGLGPLFSGDTLGSLVDVNNNSEYWKYKDGTYFWEEEEIISVPGFTKLSKKLPIAVLIGNQTGSSGEAVTISFKGNLNTILIGNETWGLTTGNEDFRLSDGSKVLLASTKMVDRNQEIYNSKIVPDIRISKIDTENDLALLEAIKWLKDR